MRRLRLEWWLLWWIIGVLVDEYLKEGYVFKPSDVLKFPTHESLLVASLCLYTAYKTYKRVRK